MQEDKDDDQDEDKEENRLHILVVVCGVVFVLSLPTQPDTPR
jgi:hypothetical protein